jgi:hypothetical protein
LFVSLHGRVVIYGGILQSGIKGSLESGFVKVVLGELLLVGGLRLRLRGVVWSGVHRMEGGRLKLHLGSRTGVEGSRLLCLLAKVIVPGLRGCLELRLLRRRDGQAVEVLGPGSGWKGGS